MGACPSALKGLLGGGTGNLLGRVNCGDVHCTCPQLRWQNLGLTVFSTTFCTSQSWYGPQLVYEWHVLVLYVSSLDINHCGHEGGKKLDLDGRTAVSYGNKTLSWLNLARR